MSQGDAVMILVMAMVAVLLLGVIGAVSAMFLFRDEEY